MNTPYLIQRGKLRLDESKNGIDSLVKFDYMGSAEFEFGALSKSIRRIRHNISEYQFYKFEQEEEKGELPYIGIYVLCKKNEQEITFEYIKKLRQGQMHTKEYTAFNEDLLGEKVNRTDFWWDIENDFMFWFDENVHIPSEYSFTKSIPKVIEPDFYTEDAKFHVGRNFKLLSPRVYPDGYELKKISDKLVIVYRKDFMNYIYEEPIGTDMVSILVDNSDDWIKYFRIIEQESYQKLEDQKQTLK